MREQEPREPGAFKASEYWLLRRRFPGNIVSADDVFLWQGKDGTPNSTLLLFRDRDLMSNLIAIGLDRGIDLEAVHPPSGDVLTDLLTELRAKGVTHVCLDPDPDRYDAIPIERAIIGFQVVG